MWKITMKTLILFIFVLIMPVSVFAEQETAKETQENSPPGTEIVLANLKVSKGKVQLSNPQNVTSRTGYDSQPVFMEKDKYIYFTRFINKQSDIYRINLKTREATPYMRTPQSEYSATSIADRDGISVVRVELDKKTDGSDAQHVYWLHKKGKQDKAALMSDMDNIGYHNWTGKNQLWMFIINGEQGDLYYQTTGRKPKLMASNIGRTLKPDEKYKNMYFVDKSMDNWWISKFDTKKFKKSKIIKLPQGVEDFEMDKKGNFWCGKDNTLYFSENGNNWMIAHEFSIPGLSGISRIAVSNDMENIAIVFNEN